MWSAHRAQSAIRELHALAEADLRVDDVHAHALEIVGRIVPFDAACVGAVDPDSLMLTSGVTLGFDPSAKESERFLELEYGRFDPTSFAELVERETPVAHSGGIPRHRRLGVRYNELTKTMGFAHDLRMAFVADGSCWAVGDLYRDTSAPDFDGDEVAFVRSAIPLIGRATRSSILVAVEESVEVDDGPAVLVLDGDGLVTAVTPAAEGWYEGLVADEPNRFSLTLGAVVSTVRAGAPSVTARMRAGSSWVSVNAARLTARSGQPGIVVSIEPVALANRMEIIVRAHGLSPREREVCMEVLAGRSTQEIAASLFIAAHTVQDHLKSVFAKVGVHSRRELVATLT